LSFPFVSQGDSVNAIRYGILLKVRNYKNLLASSNTFLSVADSPSELAREMHSLIKEKLQKGESEEAIIAYFVSKYGEWVLLKPKAQGFNLLVWALPISVTLVGSVGTLMVLRRWVRPRKKTERELWVFDPVYEERLRRELEEK